MPSASSSSPVSPEQAGADPGFGIYVHWPFCLSKCPYCDFNSHVRATIDAARWRAALLAELDHYATETAGRAATSLFFGGGTPSLMMPETVAAIIERVAILWPRPDGTPPEITLEANPGAAEAARFAAFAEAGVNRLSLGVQSFDDDALTFLGRAHDAGEARAALDHARRYFPRFSLDMIYARPGQRVAAWRAELDEALEQAGDHLSLYQLTIEPGTAFHTARRLGRLTLPDEETGAALYEETLARLAAAGLPAYEISNHARPGGECRHNLTYWRAGDYVGVGPGAHGRLATPGGGRLATRQTRAPEAWLQEVEQRGHGTAERIPVTPEERGTEMLLMGLRMVEGVRLDRLAAAAGRPLAEIVDRVRLAMLVEDGLLLLDDNRLCTTAAGRARLDGVLAALLA